MSKKALAVTGLVLAVALSPAYAAPPPTHLNQPAITDHVMLVDQAIAGGSKICGTLSFRDRAFFQAFPDGTISPTPFEVPEGSSLVITDVEWAAYGGPLGTSPLAAGNTLRLQIALAVPTSSVQVFSSRGVTLDTFSATGRPGTSEQLTAGFVVNQRVTICPTVSQVTPSFVATSYIDYIYLRGYVIPKP
jgi:hypothetical protein